MKHTLDEISSRLDNAEEKISEAEGKICKIKYKKKIDFFFKWKSTCEVWGNFKQTNIQVVGIPEEERRLRQKKKSEEIKS